jgi:hypothetical protein
MGRTIESSRRGVKTLANRWKLATRWLRRPDQKYGEQLVRMAQVHSSEGFAAFEDPLESAVFSALVELMKKNDPDRVEDLGSVTRDEGEDGKRASRWF